MKSLMEDGWLYECLHGHGERLITSLMLTTVTMMIGTALSFFIPVWATLAVIFGPGLLTFVFGGLLPRVHWSYELNTNQRLAIERYNSADAETKKLFPKDFVKTVKNAKGLGPNEDGRGSDTYRLAVAAEKIIEASRARNKSLKVGDDKVEVALTILEQNTEVLLQEVESRNEVFAPQPKRMVGRRMVDR